MKYPLIPFSYQGAKFDFSGTIIAFSIILELKKSFPNGEVDKTPGESRKKMADSKSSIKIGFLVASFFSVMILTGMVLGLEGTPDLGNNASLQGKRIFPSNNPWNQRIDTAPVDPNPPLPPRNLWKR